VELTFEQVATIVGWITSLVGVYTAMKVRLTRLETEVKDIREEEIPHLLAELEKRRQDVIKLYEKVGDNASGIQGLKIEALETFATKKTIDRIRDK
jgi:archaellum component FlaC